MPWSAETSQAGVHPEGKPQLYFVQEFIVSKLATSDVQHATTQRATCITDQNKTLLLNRHVAESF